MDELTIECKERLAKTVESFKGDLTTLRTGRATPAMLDRIAINQISSVSVPEPRQLLIKPYDKGDLKSIVAAIASSDLGINPINDGDSIRLIIPALTEDTRRDLVKKAKAKCEEAKIAIRNIRREYNDFIKESDEMTDDYKKRVQEEIQKVVDEASKNLEDILANKEKEIMAI